MGGKLRKFFRVSGLVVMYIYRPVTGALRLSAKWDGLPMRAVAWCPSPCHDGCRHVLLEDGGVVVVKEDVFREVVKSGFLVSVLADGTIAAGGDSGLPAGSEPGRAGR